MMEQAFDYLDAPMVRVAGEDVPLPYAANLEKLACRMPTRSSRRQKPSATAASAGRRTQCRSKS